VADKFGRFLHDRRQIFVGQFYWQTKLANFIFRLTSALGFHSAFNRSCVHSGSIQSIDQSINFLKIPFSSRLQHHFNFSSSSRARKINIFRSRPRSQQLFIYLLTYSEPDEAILVTSAGRHEQKSLIPVTATYRGNA